MYEQLKYINHLGEVLYFGRDGLYVNANSIHDFSWNVVSVNERISSFSRNTKTMNLPVRVACASHLEGIEKRNVLFEIPEKDVLANQYGRLVAGDYYCECFVTASKKTKYNIAEQFMAAELTITTDRPAWVKETKVSITADPNWRPDIEGGVDFPFDFAFDLCADVNRKSQITNDFFYESNFKMDIHGLTINPSVIINDHEYLVNTIVNSGEVLTIDSSTKKIYVTDTDGIQTNVFDARGRDDYIFQPIPSGALDVRWNNTFNIDLYLLEERSEPKWGSED